jgi:hypothetical protein
VLFSHCRRFAARLPLLAVGVGLLAAPAAGQTVGTAAAVNPTTQGTPPSGAMRVLRLGSEVVYRERIQTTSAGSLQVLLVDKTTLNVGPNSEIVIDEYVYDPRTGTGRAVITLGKGIMRFVGGQISHAGNATVRTPAGVIGIRGGTMTVMHGAEVGALVAGARSAFAPMGFRGTMLMGHFGIFRFGNLCGSAIIRRPGFMTRADNQADCPIEPVRVPPAMVNASLALLSSTGTQTGGLGFRPQDTVAEINPGTTPRALPPPLPSLADDLQKDAAQTLATQPERFEQPEQPPIYCDGECYYQSR